MMRMMMKKGDEDIVVDGDEIKSMMMVRMVMKTMPAAGSLGSTARSISRALTDQLDLKYFNTR